MPISISNFSTENRGRVLLLFLLFLLAMYEFVTAGFSAFAIVCLLPFVILFVYLAFSWRMFTFWTLIVVNYFIQLKDLRIPFPMSLADEALELILLAVALIDVRQDNRFNRAGNTMLFAVMIWVGFCLIEVFNNSCDLGINVSLWFTGFRLLALQLVWILLVFSVYISSPKILMTYLKLWAILSLFSAFWTYKQEYIGMTAAEKLWMETRGRTTHIINGGTLIRYFSTFSDAANYGCHAAGAAVAFIIFGITNKLRRAKIFFLFVAAIVVWGMFQSGTRTAIFCLAAGMIVYIFLSKSVKIAVPFSILFGILAFLLVFTTIGNGNQQIRRMRSAFNKDDASANVRDINQEAIKKYIRDIPWGIGLGMNANDVPANNKFKKLSAIPPDSEYVYIWVHTGPIGITIFVCCMAIMFFGACRIVLFRLRNKTVIGIGAALCSSFVAIQLGGYANQVLFQYPNGLTFFGGLAIVYILPYLDADFEEYEQKRLAKIHAKRQRRLEKKNKDKN